ncbi:MAG: hypothetical protein ACFFAJ_05675 [Candidatus Hodarchaeota archaeon]
MEPEEQFNLEGLEELDTQLKLYQMGVESYSPYVSTGKVDMIIRSEDGEQVRYADVKVCAGRREDDNIIWELEISFFMDNLSFIILAVRLPEENGVHEKHHFVLESKKFLQIAKKHKIKVENEVWVVSLPFSDLQVMNKQSSSKISTSLARSLRKYFDNWDSLLEWRINP